MEIIIRVVTKQPEFKHLLEFSMAIRTWPIYEEPKYYQFNVLQSQCLSQNRRNYTFSVSIYSSFHYFIIQSHIPTFMSFMYFGLFARNVASSMKEFEQKFAFRPMRCVHSADSCCLSIFHLLFHTQIPFPLNYDKNHMNLGKICDIVVAQNRSLITPDF